MVAYPKPTVCKDPAYLQWLRTRVCHLGLHGDCLPHDTMGKGFSEAAHSKGKSRDDLAYPLCGGHHRTGKFSRPESRVGAAQEGGEVTDRFVCPEPSVGAANAAARLGDGDHPSIESRLRAAYAIDLPRIVRQEVERALDEIAPKALDGGALYSDIMGWGRAYLASRFGAPEPEVRPGSPCPGQCPTCQPPAAPQVNAAGIDTTQFRMSEKGWRCNVCREEVVSPAHPMFHKCLTPSAGERRHQKKDRRKEERERGLDVYCSICGTSVGSAGPVALREGHVDLHLRHHCTQPLVPTPSAGETQEKLGATCIDGGKCHHNCTERCFRRECCEPLSLYKGTTWRYPDAVGARPEENTRCDCGTVCGERETHACPVYTVNERAFLRALAAERCNEACKVGNSYPALAAARKVVQDGRS